MNNYRLTISYDGTRYNGWQRLGNTENTIQGKIEGVLSLMLGKETLVTGCSRTDAGVHALMQTANFHTNRKLDEKEVLLYLEKYLPNDISVSEVQKTDMRFHSRHSAGDKTYLYKIWNMPYSSPFDRNYSMHVPLELDIRKMKNASMHFIGEHDFTAFTNAKSKKKSMVKNVKDISISRDSGFVLIRVKGDGFLHNMVRRMVGTLVEVGLGNVEPDEIKSILEKKERKAAGYVAKACGLFLEHVDYK